MNHRTQTPAAGLQRLKQWLAKPERWSAISLITSTAIGGVVTHLARVDPIQQAGYLERSGLQPSDCIPRPGERCPITSSRAPRRRAISGTLAGKTVTAKALITAAAICIATCMASAEVHAQSYGKSIQRCTLTISGRSIPFNCRWMYDGITGGTIFVDNYDTDERYIVESNGWNTVGLIGDGKRACIKSQRGATACLIR